MGTRAYWFKSGWRYRGFDPDGDPRSWTYAATLSDVRTDVAGSVGDVRFEVQRFDRQGEAFKPYGVLTRQPVTTRAWDHRVRWHLSREETP